MTRESARYEYHKERLEYNEEIGNLIPCKKEEMWKPVCEAWFSVAPNVLKELGNIHIQLLPDSTLIWFIETKWHKHL